MLVNAPSETMWTQDDPPAIDLLHIEMSGLRFKAMWQSRIKEEWSLWDQCRKCDKSNDLVMALSLPDESMN